MNFDSIFLKFGKLTSNYITKLFTYARHNYEIFENFGAMLLNIFRQNCGKTGHTNNSDDDATGRMKNDIDNQRPDRNIAVFEALTPSLRLHRSSLPCRENKKI